MPEAQVQKYASDLKINTTTSNIQTQTDNKAKALKLASSHQEQQKTNSEDSASHHKEQLLTRRLLHLLKLQVKTNPEKTHHKKSDRRQTQIITCIKSNY